MNQNTKRAYQIFKSAVTVILIILLFLISIDLLVASLEHLSKDFVQSIISITNNPFISLFIGIVTTAIIQSSSTTTSMIVAMVASGSIDLTQAIPMVMGANIGTTLTSNIVSLSFFTKKEEFRRAMSASTTHSLFNIFVTIILFPLQYYYNFLGYISQKLTHLITFHNDSVSLSDVSYSIVHYSPISERIVNLIGNHVAVLIISVVILFLSIKLLSKVIYQLLIGPAKERFENFIFINPFKSFGWGVALTASIQSSSVTTSLIVPLVATRRVNLQSAFSFIMGANVGTTITAFLAAFFKTETTVSIAMAHLLFNVMGVLIFLPFPVLRNVPLSIARYFGALVMKHRIISLIYIILIFFLLPFAFIYLSR